MRVESSVLIACPNPLRTIPSLISMIATHQPSFEPGRSGCFSMFHIPYMNRPLIAGSSFQWKSGIFDIQGFIICDFL